MVYSQSRPFLQVILAQIQSRRGDIYDIIAWLKKAKIDTVLDRTGDKVERVLLTSQEVLECNGAILDVETREWLAIPPLGLISTFDPLVIDEGLKQSQFSSVPVGDGTVLTLYYWPRGRKWCIGSAHSYDLTYVRPMGSHLTYAYIVFQLMFKVPHFVQRAGLGIVRGRLEFSKINKAFCYSIGVRHPATHYFDIEPAAIWTIQTLYTTEFFKQQACQQGLPGIPLQSSLHFDSLNDIYSYLHNAPQDAIKHRFAPHNTNVIRSSTYRPRFKYGVILQNTHKSYLISSRLLDILRALLYNHPTPMIHLSLKVQQTYHFLLNYLSQNIEYTMLIPIPDELFMCYEHVHNELLTNMEILHHRPSSRKSPANDCLHQWYHAYDTHIFNKSLVSTFIKHPKFLYIYLFLINM